MTVRRHTRNRDFNRPVVAKGGEGRGVVGDFSRRGGSRAGWVQGRGPERVGKAR